MLCTKLYEKAYKSTFVQEITHNTYYRVRVVFCFFVLKESDLSQLWEELGTGRSRIGNWRSGKSPANQSEKPGMPRN